jgi:hypothetical protein
VTKWVGRQLFHAQTRLPPSFWFAATMRWHGTLGAKGLRRIACERQVTWQVTLSAARTQPA